MLTLLWISNTSPFSRCPTAYKPARERLDRRSVTRVLRSSYSRVGMTLQAGAKSPVSAVSAGRILQYSKTK